MKVISSYTKKEAVNDGQQLDVTEFAKEVGFKIPVYVTIGVHNLCSVPKDLKGFQDYQGRLWDVLSLAYFNVVVELKKENPEYFMSFKVDFLMSENELKTKKLYLIFNSAEGFTVLLPDEY